MPALPVGTPTPAQVHCAIRKAPVKSSAHHFRQTTWSRVAGDVVIVDAVQIAAGRIGYRLAPVRVAEIVVLRCLRLRSHMV